MKRTESQLNPRVSSLKRLTQGTIVAGIFIFSFATAEASVTSHSVLSERVFDPKLSGAQLSISSRANGSGSYSATLTIRDSQGQLVRSIFSGKRNTGQDYRDTWSGHDVRGFFVKPGAYSLRFEADGKVRENPVNVTRLGILAMRFDDAKNGQKRIPLAFHRPDANIVGNAFAVDSAGLPWILEASALGARCLDDANGLPLPVPSKWTKLSSPPRTQSGQIKTRGRALPIAYPQASKPQITMLLGSQAGHQGRAVDCGYPVQGVQIAVLLGNSYAVDLSPGKVLSLEAPQLGDGLNKQNLNLDFRFAYNAGQGWRWVPGSVKTQHDCYTTIGRPQTDDGMAWVAALDLAARRGGPSVKTQRDGSAKMVELINGDLLLRYDTFSGAPAYTDAPRGLENPSLDLGAFLDSRRFGSRVNCLDCASIVGTLARHIGSPNYVVIMGWDFRLHWIRGIGGARFIHDLFGSHSFSYHAIASYDQGGTIHDACLSVDADTRPDRSPFKEGLPRAMTYTDYRRQLTPERTPIQSIGAATTR